MKWPLVNLPEICRPRQWPTIQVAQPQITGQSLARFQIPLPPLAEQKRIAAILDAADALRAKRREALAQLDALQHRAFRGEL